MQKNIDKERTFRLLVGLLLEEIKRIKKELPKTWGKEKARLRRELRMSSLALAELLQLLPEESEVEDWLRIIAEKAPKKFIKRTKQILGNKFAEKSRKDAGSKKIPLRGHHQDTE